MTNGEVKKSINARIAQCLFDLQTPSVLDATRLPGGASRWQLPRHPLIDLASL
jgi:hypothetical protein